MLPANAYMTKTDICSAL